MAHKILTVDDHAETLDIVVLTLQSYGYEVISTLSPAEGLKLAQQELPDLILLDVNMPEMDGLEVCRRIRAMPPLADVPIIMFTAEDEPYQKIAGFDAGADDYLTKPTNPEEMIARIEGILGTVDEFEDAPKVESPPPIAELFSDETIVIPSNRESEEAVAVPAIGKLIGVLGVRGGAGATLSAINLAVSIARLGAPTTLMDLDMTQGHISLYLNQRVTGSLNTLADVPPEDIDQWLPQQFVELSEHLRLLLAHPNLDGRFPYLSVPQTDAILSSLIQSGQHVVVDMGHGPSDVYQHVLERVDQLLVCLPPERIALSVAKALLKQLQQNLSPFTTLNPIILDVGDYMVLPRKAVESYLEHTLQDVISVSIKELAQSVNKGDVLIRAYDQGKTAKQFYQLAKQFVKTEKGYS